MPKKRGKKYIEAAKKVEAAVASNGNGGLEPEVACQMVRETSISKFDATVEAHIRLGVDPRHAEQMVRGSVVLPNGTGKKVRVAVFAVGEKAREAQDAGADVVGGDDLVKRVTDGWTDFDSAIATPDMMSKVGPLGKVLGPRGLMPNPKSGTVTQDVARAVREAKGGKVEFRTDKFGIIHVPIGKVSFDQAQLHQHLATRVDAPIPNKPATSQGHDLDHADRLAERPRHDRHDHRRQDCLGQRTRARAHAAASRVRVHAAAAAQAEVGIRRRERGQRPRAGGGRLPRGGTMAPRSVRRWGVARPGSHGAHAGGLGKGSRIICDLP